MPKLLESVQAKFVSRFEEFLEPDLELDMEVCRVNYWDPAEDAQAAQFGEAEGEIHDPLPLQNNY